MPTQLMHALPELQVRTETTPVIPETSASSADQVALQLSRTRTWTYRDGTRTTTYKISVEVYARSKQSFIPDR